MATGLGGWKTKITSTIRSNARMNALLNDSVTLVSLGKKKNLSKYREALQQETQSNVSSESKDDNALTQKKPNIEQIYRILQETVAEQLNGETFFRTYNSQISPKFCQILSREIRTRIKLLKQERYIFIHFIFIYFLFIFILHVIFVFNLFSDIELYVLLRLLKNCNNLSIIK